MDHLKKQAKDKAIDSLTRALGLLSVAEGHSGEIIIPPYYPKIPHAHTFYRFEGYGDVWECRFRLIKETPCGYWIGDYDDSWSMLPKKKWISKTARKRFAYQIRKAALESYIARKRKQIKIMEEQVSLIKIGLTAVEMELQKESKHDPT
jgi:hypothetical protein